MRNIGFILRLRDDPARVKAYIVFFLVGCVAFLLQQYIYSIPFNSPPIRSDGQGYYMYLPAFFVYHDPKMLFLDRVNDVGSFISTYWRSETGAMVDKYTMGTALLQFPFFLIAHSITVISSPNAADGFSSMYQVFNGVSACFWLVVGSVFSYELGRKFAQERYACLAVIVCVFGSNLLHYASYDASFSHVYSFAIISIFLYWIYETKVNDTSLCFFIGGLLLGIIMLIRITDVTIILCFPLLGGGMMLATKASFLEGICCLIHPKRSFLFLVGILVSLSPQLFYWKYVTGHWLVNSYSMTDEGFKYWDNPRIINVLFLVERGIFFWCPVLLIGITVCCILYKQRKLLICSFFPFFFLYVYVISSWWSFTLAGGYSHRIFVNIMSVFILFMAVALNEIFSCGVVVRSILIICIVVLVCWNLICMYSYWEGIIPYDNCRLEDVENALRNLI